MVHFAKRKIKFGLFSGFNTKLRKLKSFLLSSRYKQTRVSQLKTETILIWKQLSCLLCGLITKVIFPEGK